MSIESICNQALDIIGYKRHIGNIYEGTLAARVALDIWGQTRDELFNALKPEWAHKDATLMLLKSAPTDYGITQWNNTYPEIPWLYEYQYPSDCIQPLQIKATPLFLPVWRPRAKLFRQNFDVTSGRTILTNEPNAILNYVAQVLDTTQWQSDFVTIVVSTLAKKFEAEFAVRPPAKEQQNASNPPS